MIAWLLSRRGLAVLLIVSVAANLFFAGMLAGRFTGHVTQESPTRRSIQAMLAPLPTDKRDLVRREIGVALPEVRAQFTALQKARAALAAEMTKTTVDDAAVKRSFDAVQAYTLAIRAALNDALQRALPGLTQEERRLLVQGLLRREGGSALP